MTTTTPATDELMAMLQDRRRHWDKYRYIVKGDEIVTPVEWDAVAERLSQAEGRCRLLAALNYAADVEIRLLEAQVRAGWPVPLEQP